MIVKDGIYNEQIRPLKSGTQYNPITIKAENTGKAIIQMVSNGTDSIISHITIDGLIARGKGEHPAIRVNSVDNVDISKMVNI